jgi:hypothetical protein
MSPIRLNWAQIVRLLSVILPLALIGVMSAMLAPRTYLPIIRGPNIMATSPTTPSATPLLSNSIPAFSHVFIILMI